MVPPYFWESGTMEPWNHGTKVPGYTFWVPWFHGSTQNLNVKNQKFCWVDPWNHGTKVPGYTKKVPWFHGSTQFFWGWNGGTMEPWFQATHLRFHGSMVPGWNHGTMEPWNPNVYYV